jgi:hypothetical protein
LKPNTPELMKFKRLQRRLGVTVPQLVGHLELLWIATAKNAPTGDIGRFENEDIAIACCWDGEPDEFVSSLVDCGWLDVSDEYRLVVHDWAQHAPSWVIGNLARHKRTPLSGAENSTRQPTKQPAKEVAKQPAMEPAMEATTYPILSSPILDTHTHTHARDAKTEVLIPGWMAGPWSSFLEAWRLMHGKGLEMPTPTQEQLIYRLSQLGQEKALADLAFMVERTSKGYLDSDNDFQKRRQTGNNGKVNKATKF